MRSMVCVALWIALGCGDSGGGSDGTAATGASGSGGTTGGTSAGTSSGTGGTSGGGAGGSPATGGDAGGSMAPDRVICGGVGGYICTETAELMGRTLGPCCDTDSGDLCGAGFGSQCEALHQAGESSDDCPSETDVLGGPLNGCCRPDGACGVWIEGGFGCVERSDVSEIGVGPFDAQSCGSTTPGDAGSMPADGGAP